MAEQHEFDKGYRERHRAHCDGPGAMGGSPPNPHLVRETAGLMPGTALDAACGAGAGAIWLALWATPVAAPPYRRDQDPPRRPAQQAFLGTNAAWPRGRSRPDRKST